MWRDLRAAGGRAAAAASGNRCPARNTDRPACRVIVMLAELGSVVQAGDAIADVIDPIAGTTTTLRAGTAGVFYVFARHPYVTRGSTVAKIAGTASAGQEKFGGLIRLPAERRQAGSLICRVFRPKAWQRWVGRPENLQFHAACTDIVSV
jgi:hypothetical protein